MQRVLILVGLAAGCGDSGLGRRDALAGPSSRGASSSEVTGVSVPPAPPSVPEGLCGAAGICDLPTSCEVVLAELSGV